MSELHQIEVRGSLILEHRIYIYIYIYITIFPSDKPQGNRLISGRTAGIKCTTSLFVFKSLPPLLLLLLLLLLLWRHISWVPADGGGTSCERCCHSPLRPLLKARRMHAVSESPAATVNGIGNGRAASGRTVWTASQVKWIDVNILPLYEAPGVTMTVYILSLGLRFGEKNAYFACTIFLYKTPSFVR